MNHVKPLRLFDFARSETSDHSFSLEQWEEEHLFECGECQDRLESFISQTDSSFDD